MQLLYLQKIEKNHMGKNQEIVRPACVHYIRLYVFPSVR